MSDFLDLPLRVYVRRHIEIKNNCLADENMEARGFFTVLVLLVSFLSTHGADLYTLLFLQH